MKPVATFVEVDLAALEVIERRVLWIATAMVNEANSGRLPST
jgi:hypothetical protein